MGFIGKVPRNHTNMRVEFAQMCALKADHFPMTQIQSINAQYDIAILLVGKTASFREQIFNIDIVSEARRFAKKVLWMQEGPHWIFQDMPLPHQFWHYNVLANVDGLLVENKTDIKYFKGLLSDDSWVQDIPSLMITDYITGLINQDKEDKIIIGGNFCRWYGGFDSYICARDLQIPIWAPSMGRKVKGEDQIQDINYIPYCSWVEWVEVLSKFKYAIHLMPTAGAGTFNMNCAFLGIPCIAYDHIDTQTQLFPELTVDLGNIQEARKLLNRLKNDKDFYEECSTNAKLNFCKYHSEDVFTEEMLSKFKTL